MIACGIGYDVHRFAVGRPLVLGGVTIAHSAGLEGHSDADVLCHAIADALLGAAGQRDIGHWFPDSDASMRGMSSLLIISKAAGILRERAMAIVNVDATLIAEAPRIAPHLEAMKRNLSAAISIPEDCIGVKATTNEGLGFLGRGEGIAALAVASVDRQAAG